MTTENLQTQVESTTQPVDAETKSEVTLTVEQALEKAASAEAKFLEAIADRDKAKQKLRKLEESASAAEELQKKLDELATKYEATTTELTSFKENIKNQTVTQTLTTALEAVGAKSVSTVMKLVDKSLLQFDEQGQLNADSVVAAIEEVRNSDPILFGDPTDPKDAATTAQTGKPNLDPGVRRAGEASTEGAFEKEIKAAKTQREIENVLRKYGKM